MVIFLSPVRGDGLEADVRRQHLDLPASGDDRFMPGGTATPRNVGGAAGLALGHAAHQCSRRRTTAAASPFSALRRQVRRFAAVRSGW
jgi:hypothetical protein